MDWVALDFPSIDATPGLRLIYSHLEKKFAIKSGKHWYLKDEEIVHNARGNKYSKKIK